MQTNATADAGLDSMSVKDKRMCERRLFEMASQADVTVKEGLELRISTVDDWAKLPNLRGVRKLRIGRHRLYISGKHTDCHYTLIHVLVSKREEEDKPETKKFQNMMDTSLSDAAIRRILETPPEKQADEEN